MAARAALLTFGAQPTNFLDLLCCCRDWAPLFIQYTAARGSYFDDGEGDVEAAVAAARAAAAAAAHAAAAEAIADKAAVERPAKKARRGGEADDAAAVEERRKSNAAASTSADAAAAAATPAKGRGKGKKGAGDASASTPAAPAPAPALPSTSASAPASAPPATASATVSVLSRIGGKTWRAGLLDWLKLLSGLKGVRGLHRCEELQRAVASHLLEPDAGVQGAALKCLRPWRLRWLPVEMADRLARLVDDNTLRVRRGGGLEGGWGRGRGKGCGRVEG